MNDTYNQMLSKYNQTTEQQRRNAIFEVNQQIILAGLYSGGFFDVAAFYGGTCLRIFHGLQRFSEDMDFSLIAPNDNFDFTQYFQPIIDEFALVGREVEIKKKDKRNFGKVESAFIKDNTDVYELLLTRKSLLRSRLKLTRSHPCNSIRNRNLSSCQSRLWFVVSHCPTYMQERCTPWCIAHGKTG